MIAKWEMEGMVQNGRKKTKVGTTEEEEKHVELTYKLTFSSVCLESDRSQGLDRLARVSYERSKMRLVSSCL